jgi:hypothetical protein
VNTWSGSSTVISTHVDILNPKGEFTPSYVDQRLQQATDSSLPLIPLSRQNNALLSIFFFGLLATMNILYKY